MPTSSSPSVRLNVFYEEVKKSLDFKSSIERRGVARIKAVIYAGRNREKYFAKPFTGQIAKNFLCVRIGKQFSKNDFSGTTQQSVRERKCKCVIIFLAFRIDAASKLRLIPIQNVIDDLPLDSAPICFRSVSVLHVVHHDLNDVIH